MTRILAHIMVIGALLFPISAVADDTENEAGENRLLRQCGSCGPSLGPWFPRTFAQRFRHRSRGLVQGPWGHCDESCWEVRGWSAVSATGLPGSRCLFCLHLLEDRSLRAGQPHQRCRNPMARLNEASEIKRPWQIQLDEIGTWKIRS